MISDMGMYPMDKVASPLLHISPLSWLVADPDNLPFASVHGESPRCPFQSACIRGYSNPNHTLFATQNSR